MKVLADETVICCKMEIEGYGEVVKDGIEYRVYECELCGQTKHIKEDITL